jgi:AcrR family transcriptional regulator
MGKLIDSKKRERAKQQRGVRKKRILEEARLTFVRMPYVEVSLDGIGQSADVVRGIASMFFRTKEELFLLLLRAELAEWYQAIEQSLGDLIGSLDRKALAEWLARSVVDRPVMTRFLSLTPMVLEQNIEVMEVFRFQRWRRDRMAEAGESLERSTSALQPGQGSRLLYLVQLVAAGLEPAANPRGSAAFDRGDPEFDGFWIDLEAELKRIVTGIMESWDEGEEVRGEG